MAEAPCRMPYGKGKVCMVSLYMLLRLRFQAKTHLHGWPSESGQLSALPLLCPLHVTSCWCVASIAAFAS
jgi:hypothetical protein